MRKIVTVIDCCNKCPFCSMQEPTEGDLGELDVYCTKMKGEYGMPLLLGTISDGQELSIPSDCPCEQNEN